MAKEEVRRFLETVWDWIEERQSLEAEKERSRGNYGYTSPSERCIEAVELAEGRVEEALNTLLTEMLNK